jgi:hypothetical protein
MIRKPLPLLLAAALIVPALAVPADAARKRHNRIAKPAPAARQVTPAFHQAPARMIEIAPGRWISSWGCYTDEGYGRYSSCDMREGPK